MLIPLLTLLLACVFQPLDAWAAGSGMGALILKISYSLAQSMLLRRNCTLLP